MELVWSKLFSSTVRLHFMVSTICPINPGSTFRFWWLMIRSWTNGTLSRRWWNTGILYSLHISASPDLCHVISNIILTATNYRCAVKMFTVYYLLELNFREKWKLLIKFNFVGCLQTFLAQIFNHAQCIVQTILMVYIDRAYRILAISYFTSGYSRFAQNFEFSREITHV